MARIAEVDYMAMSRQAKDMRGKGNELNTELTTAYNSVGEMHNAWYGQRYNELAKAFNNLAPKVNEMLKLVVGEIPFTLETIANNYAQADRGSNAGSAENTPPKAVPEIATPTDVGMKFMTSEVESTKTAVSTNFTVAQEKMNEIGTVLSQVQWDSEAAEAFRSKFAQLKGQITESFNDINKQFGDLMQQTLDDIQRTETANTVQ